MRKIGQVLMLIPLEFTSLELSNFTSCNVNNWYFPIFLTLNIRFLPNNLKWNERASRALVLWYISLIWWRWKPATFTKWFTVRIWCLWSSWASIFFNEIKVSSIRKFINSYLIKTMCYKKLHILTFTSYPVDQLNNDILGHSMPIFWEKKQ